MDRAEVTIDLLELLDELGYLEGARWQHIKCPSDIVQVTRRTREVVSYGRPGAVYNMSVRGFLEWYRLMPTTRSNTSGGGIASGAMLSKSSV